MIEFDICIESLAYEIDHYRLAGTPCKNKIVGIPFHSDHSTHRLVQGDRHGSFCIFVITEFHLLQRQRIEPRAFGRERLYAQHIAPFKQQLINLRVGGPVGVVAKIDEIILAHRSQIGSAVKSDHGIEIEGLGSKYYLS